MGRGGKEDGKPRGELEVKIGFTYHERSADDEQFLGVPGSEGRGSFGSLADDNSSTSGKKKSPSLLNVSSHLAHQFGGSLMNLGKKVKRKTSSRNKKNKRKDSDAVSESAFSSNADPGVNSDSEEDEAFKDEIASTVSAASSGAGGYDAGIHSHSGNTSSSNNSTTGNNNTNNNNNINNNSNPVGNVKSGPLHEDMASDAFYRRLEYNDFYEQPRRSVEPSPPTTTRDFTGARKSSSSFREEALSSGSPLGILSNYGNKEQDVNKSRTPSDSSSFANRGGSNRSNSGVLSARRSELLSSTGVSAATGGVNIEEDLGGRGSTTASARSSAQPSPLVKKANDRNESPQLPNRIEKPPRQHALMKEDISMSTPCIPAVISGSNHGERDGSTTPGGGTPLGTPDGSRRNSATKGTKERFLRKFNVKEMLKGSSGEGKGIEEDPGSGSKGKNKHHLSHVGEMTTAIENGEERIISKPASRHPLSVQQRFANMQRDDLIALVLQYESQAKQRENKMRDTEEYLDALLLRVMESSPLILSHGFSPSQLSNGKVLENTSCRQEVKTGRFRMF
ncbi:unnamed protein product [Notodromas monacha]|uniref:FIP-RBD domain-containing protein n=1 Tax=Notodromas monacha TaxID=399045 RepID=A0A7R9BXH1_9CRUS|nr:unnamed protein product [Notodromas monacha]CAG0921922.1 unnamed protein product [Notodromas monacha]